MYIRSDDSPELYGRDFGGKLSGKGKGVLVAMLSHLNSLVYFRGLRDVNFFRRGKVDDRKGCSVLVIIIRDMNTQV